MKRPREEDRERRFLGEGVVLKSQSQAERQQRTEQWCKEREKVRQQEKGEMEGEGGRKTQKTYVEGVQRSPDRG